MRQAIQLLREDRRARFFFLALAQSAVGTGVGYVALILIAYERFDSPWAIGLVLFADLVPAMLLGPVFGAAADRWSKRTCLILADVLRAGAFVGIALVSSIEATIVLAAVAGTGTGLFTPAALSALPGLVEERRVAAATSLYGAIADLAVHGQRGHLPRCRRHAGVSRHLGRGWPTSCARSPTRTSRAAACSRPARSSIGRPSTC